MIDEKLLKNDELAVYKLRSLYSSFGYAQYKMSKFEEYDLYVRNKDFLISDRVITFNDTNGKLLALKPDVTLSIINHLNNGQQGVRKVYYNENVYRVSGESHRFKEIMQTGLECMGKIGIYEMCEVVMLAIKSLEMIDSEYQLDISHVGLVRALIEQIGVSEKYKNELLQYISLKNDSAVEAMTLQNKISVEQAQFVCKLIDNYADISGLENALGELSSDSQACFDEFKAVLNALNELGISEKININLSLANDTDYYSGIAFKGYIEGIPTGVLSGGRYDILMRKLNKDAGAIGFAVYLDGIERLNAQQKEYDVDVLILSDGSVAPQEILKITEECIQSGESVLVCEDVPDKLRYKRLADYRRKETQNA